MKTLQGHTSKETAYVQPDYPYGRRLRCKRRVWVETKRGHGQRVVTQTTDPKRSYEYWNTPKASTYHDSVVLTLDDTETSATYGYVEPQFYATHDGEAKLEAFLAAHGAAVDAEAARFFRRSLARRSASR